MLGRDRQAGRLGIEVLSLNISSYIAVFLGEGLFLLSRYFMEQSDIKYRPKAVYEIIPTNAESGASE